MDRAELVARNVELGQSSSDIVNAGERANAVACKAQHANGTAYTERPQPANLIVGQVEALQPAHSLLLACLSQFIGRAIKQRSFIEKEK